jgi:hypothetical protein
LKFALTHGLISPAVLALALSACATSNSHTYKLYPGPERPAAELATLDVSGVDSVIIDGLEVRRWDYGTVLLLPGEHQLVSTETFGFSVLVEPAMLGTFESTLDVTLDAGKAYKVIGDRTTGHGYRIYFWVEEAQSGRVIAGEKKP